MSRAVGGRWRRTLAEESKPAYVVHEIPEEEMTVDWFFGEGRWTTKIPQFLAMLVGWFFAILPIWITVSALIHRKDGRGWWHYREGYVMWSVTMSCLGILAVAMIVGYLLLHFLDRRVSGWEEKRITYDEERLDVRLDVAEEMYAEKFGPEPLRLGQRDVRVEPYGDLETYELRERYRLNDVGEE